MRKLRKKQKKPDVIENCNICLDSLEWGAIITWFIFFKIFTIDAPQLVLTGKLWGVFMISKSDLCSDVVNALQHELIEA